MMRAIKSGLIAVGLLVIAAVITLHVRYGGGEAFPDRTGKPVMSIDQLEVVADLPLPPGNISVSETGRVFFTFHPEAKPDIKVAELVDGKPVPFPNMDFQTGEGGQNRYFRNVLSIRVDRQNRLWTLDNGHHGFDATRLLAFDLDSGRIVHEHIFVPGIAGLGSHLNDFQVAPNGRTLYIADASFFAKTPAIIVYDVATKHAQRRIEAHPSVVAEDYLPVVQGRKMKAFGLVTIRPGVDSIALDKRGEWLYFAPITNNHLYRVSTEDLNNPKLGNAALRDKIEIYAEKTMSDGLSMDRDDGIYISDLEHSAILRLDSKRQLTTLLKDERLRWPDGFSFGPDGWLYVTCSSLQDVIGKSAANVAAHAPYQIFRFRPGYEGVPGH